MLCFLFQEEEEYVPQHQKEWSKRFAASLALDNASDEEYDDWAVPNTEYEVRLNEECFIPCSLLSLVCS
jgi:hypothetical protein